MGLERHKQAEEYLSLANWAVVKTPDVGLDVRSQLHRNFGKLYASQVSVLPVSGMPRSAGTSMSLPQSVVQGCGAGPAAV